VEGWEGVRERDGGGLGGGQCEGAYLVDSVKVGLCGVTLIIWA